MIKRIALFISLVVLGNFTASTQDIDLSHWKITIPAGEDKPIEVSPPEINDFETNEVLKPYFYRDPEDGALVFYSEPAQTTRNTKYSRSELREQMEPGSNSVNWTFEEGGHMRGTLSVPKVSQDKVGNYHRVIIMQIHGRLSNEQRDLIGEDDNNAPPVLKIYWDEGRIRVKTKILKNPEASDEEILHENAWGDDKGRNFKEIVGTNKFTLEVNVSKGLMTVTLNDRETFVYDGVDMERWGVFENYFKAGNYFQSRDNGSYAYVKYYDLKVSHNPKDYVERKNEAPGVALIANPNPSGIDLTNWKLEIPTGYTASDWKLSNFENDKFVKDFFYIDPSDSALVMEAYPAEGTSKSKYTRNTLREQMQPGSNDLNWTMKMGGVLEAEVQVAEMSKDARGKFHKTILFQVDGRTTKEQTEELRLSKPASIPFLKIIWNNGELRIKRRVLKNVDVVGDDLLLKSSWTESDDLYLRGKPEFGKFRIRMELKKGRISIQVNDEKPMIIRDMNVNQWYFENYFTVGNYLQSKDANAHAVVKYYKINVSHKGKKK